jgi:hypothetical protein
MAGSRTVFAHRIKHDHAGEGRYESRKKFLRSYDLRERMQAIVAPGAEDEDRQQASWEHQPWLTPVVGSGPLGLPTEFVQSAHLLPLAFLERFGPDSLLENDTFRGVSADPTAWLFHFVRTMVVERMGHLTQLDFPTPFKEKQQAALASQVEDVAGKLSDLTCAVVLAAAQLTRTFHEISLNTCRSVSRWGSEHAVMSTEHDQWHRLKSDYLDLLSAACKQAQRQIKARRQVEGDTIPYKAITELLRTVTTEAMDADQAEVRIVHLQQLTEIGWALTVQDISGASYPGWTDLLLRLVLTDDQNIELNYKRPRWGTLEALARRVRELVEPPSMRTWLLPEADAASRRNREFYDAVACVLWEQNIQRMANAGSTSPVPPSVAFVTSFDYELEMALWRTAHKYAKRLRALGGDCSFTVLLPVYATAGNSAREGEFLWLEGRVLGAPVRPEEPDLGQFEKMRDLQSWRAVGGHRASRDYHASPTIIRLSGCPLVNLPATPDDALIGDLNRLGIKSTGDDLRFEHSITIDEYLALRQTEDEWLWSRQQGEKARSLPQHLTDPGASEEALRYWMVMGVPFKDPAVRIRLLSVLARQSSQSTDKPAQGQSNTVHTRSEPGTAKPQRKRLGRYGESKASANRDRPAMSAERPPDTADSIAEPPPRIKKDEPEARRVATVRGAAINVRVDDEEAILFNAIGLTVITEQCETFTRDINDYAGWLAKQGERVAKASNEKSKGKESES